MLHFIDIVRRSNRKTLIQSRHNHPGSFQAGSKLAHYRFVAMNKIGAFGIAGLLVPCKQFSLIGMRGKSVDRIDPGAHGKFFPVDFHFFGAIDDIARECACGSVADK